MKDIDVDIHEEDVEELKEMFATKKSSPLQTTSTNTKKKAKILDGRRANNIEIGLAQFKSVCGLKTR